MTKAKAKAKPLTAVEHRARALLLGYRYALWANAYIQQTQNGVWLDADTLAPMTREDKDRRFLALAQQLSPQTASLIKSSYEGNDQ